jgi:hypothetical protein
MVPIKSAGGCGFSGGFPAGLVENRPMILKCRTGELIVLVSGSIRVGRSSQPGPVPFVSRIVRFAGSDRSHSSGLSVNETRTGGSKEVWSGRK